MTLSDSQQTFSFSSFLGQYSWFNPTEWIIDELAGGAANHTVRIRRCHGGHSIRLLATTPPSPTPTPTSYPNSQDAKSEINIQDTAGVNYRKILEQHESVVMKQAPEYLAKAPTFEFSAYRQVVEAAALHLLHLKSSVQHPLHSVVERHPNIRLPQLLAHDTQEKILVQSDLGPHPSLYDVLVSSEVSEAEAAEVGDIIGRFLSDMHVTSAAWLSITSGRDTIARLEQIFQNDDAERLLKMIIQQTIVHMRAVDLPDAEQLGDRALKHWDEREKKVFGQGDLWFGTLLVHFHHDHHSDSLEFSRSGINQGHEGAILRAKPSVEIGICDWEFAGPNHLAADIAQLGCYFHLLSLSSFTTPTTRQRIQASARRMYSAYFDSIRPLWGQCNAESRDSSDSAIVTTAKEFFRSLLIIHGWEMINAAGWKTRQGMWCACPGDGVKCGHIRSLVEMGACLIRAAGDGDEDVDLEAVEGIEWCRLFFTDRFRLLS